MQTASAVLKEIVLHLADTRQKRVPKLSWIDSSTVGSTAPTYNAPSASPEPPRSELVTV